MPFRMVFTDHTEIGSYRNPEGLKYNYLLKYPLHLPINLLIVFNIYYNPR